jgi:hypothetical protein
MTLANPRHRVNWGKNPAICGRCNKPFPTDGRGSTPKFCKPCKVLNRRDMQKRKYAAKYGRSFDGE